MGQPLRKYMTEDFQRSWRSACSSLGGGTAGASAEGEIQRPRQTTHNHRHTDGTPGLSTTGDGGLRPPRRWGRRHCCGAEGAPQTAEANAGWARARRPAGGGGGERDAAGRSLLRVSAGALRRRQRRLRPPAGVLPARTPDRCCRRRRGPRRHLLPLPLPLLFLLLLLPLLLLLRILPLRLLFLLLLLFLFFLFLLLLLFLVSLLPRPSLRRPGPRGAVAAREGGAGAAPSERKSRHAAARQWSGRKRCGWRRG